VILGESGTPIPRGLLASLSGPRQKASERAMQQEEGRGSNGEAQRPDGRSVAADARGRATRCATSNGASWCRRSASTTAGGRQRLTSPRGQWRTSLPDKISYLIYLWQPKLYPVNIPPVAGEQHGVRRALRFRGRGAKNGGGVYRWPEFDSRA
jgi:hypothetical protein